MTWWHGLHITTPRFLHSSKISRSKSLQSYATWVSMYFVSDFPDLAACLVLLMLLLLITLLTSLRYESLSFWHTGKIPISWQGLIDMNALPANPISNAQNGSSTVTSQPSVLAPWKCWGGLAGNAASKGKADAHPIVSSACWYLDFDSEWNDYLRVDPVATAREAPVPSRTPTSAPTDEESMTQSPSTFHESAPKSRPLNALSDTKVSVTLPCPSIYI